MSSADRARALKALNTVATELKDCSTVGEVCERTVAAADRILEFDFCVINLEEDGMLPIAALSADVPPDGATPMSVEEGLVGKAYRQGRTILIDDVAGDAEANPQGPYRSALTIPIGEYGVFQTVSTDPADFDDADRELGELLIAHCLAALERLGREAEAREHARTLERQNARLAEFAHVVSHDLRNPLSVLEGYLELARETGEDEHFDRCEEMVDRMNRLIADLLTLARQGETVGNPEPVELQPLAERCWRNVDTRSSRLEVVDSLTIAADPERLQQLLENLFRNAIEHGATDGGGAAAGTADGEATDAGTADGEATDAGTADSGTVDAETADAGTADAENAGDDAAAVDSLTVTIGGLPDGAGFYVEDDGVGIPEDERDRVLEAGYSTGDGGTGFGLGIVSEIAEAHGWEVQITEATGGGARFEFAIRSAAVAESANPDRERSERSPGSGA